MRAIAYYRQDNPDYKIVITGLSLGGAIARCTCFFLNDRNQFPGAAYELYTFGEFRVGNIPFAEYMNSLNMTSVRVVHRYISEWQRNRVTKNDSVSITEPISFPIFHR